MNFHQSCFFLFTFASRTAKISKSVFFTYIFQLPRTNWQTCPTTYISHFFSQIFPNCSDDGLHKLAHMFHLKTTARCFVDREVNRRQLSGISDTEHLAWGGASANPVFPRTIHVNETRRWWLTMPILIHRCRARKETLQSVSRVYLPDSLTGPPARLISIFSYIPVILFLSSRFSLFFLLWSIIIIVFLPMSLFFFPRPLSLLSFHRFFILYLE